MAIYRDIYDGPPRWYTERVTRKKYIMIHATANDASAEAEANFAKHRDTRVSSHYYVDDDSIVQSLDTDYRAWHAGNTEGNDHAIAYELTARNMNVGRAWWVDLANIEWPLMTAAIARDCREHGITPRDLTVAQLRAGDVTGFCMHFEGNQAWGGSDHTDPGPNFPMDHLVSQVQAAMRGEDDMQLDDRIDLTHGGKRLWAGELMDRDSITVGEALMWGLGVGPHKEVLPALGKLAGQVAGLTSLVRELAAAPPVPVTPEQLAALTAAVEQAAASGAADALERVQITVDETEGGA